MSPPGRELGRVFLGLGRPTSSGEPSEAMVARLQEILAAAHAAWPDLHVDDLDFVRHLARHLPGEGDALEALTRLRASELYIACACARGARGALEAFERSFVAWAPTVLGRYGDSLGFVEDVLQELRKRIFVGADGAQPRIATYEGQGSLEGWTRVTAVRIAIQLSARSHRELLTDDLDLAAGDRLGRADPEIAIIQERYRKDFSAAFRAALAALTVEDRNLLRFYVIDGLNIAQIGAIFAVHRATVARWIARCREKVLEDTRQNLRARLNLGDGSVDVDSMMRLLQSQLDVSLHRFLAPA